MSDEMVLDRDGMAQGGEVGGGVAAEVAAASPWAGNGCPPGSNRGGGPKTAAGLERCAEARTTHGIYRMLNTGLLPGCDICKVAHLCAEYAKGGICAQGYRAIEEVATRVMGAEHITPLSHDVVREYAKNVVFLEVVDKHLQMDGLFHRQADQGGEYGPLQEAPLLTLRAKLSSAMLAYAKELGLTPSAQARAKLTAAGDSMSQLTLLFEQMTEAATAAAERAEQMTMDGEFEDGGEA